MTIEITINGTIIPAAIVPLLDLILCSIIVIRNCHPHNYINHHHDNLLPELGTVKLKSLT